MQILTQVSTWKSLSVAIACRIQLSYSYIYNVFASINPEHFEYMRTHLLSVVRAVDIVVAVLGNNINFPHF